MIDDEDVAAEQRAYRRRFPFIVIGALALLIGVGFCAAGIEYWPWTAGAIVAGAASIWFGDRLARRERD